MLANEMYEIFEIIVIVALLLIIGGAIVIVSDPDSITGATIGNELKYLLTLKSDDTSISINAKEDVHITLQDENRLIIMKKENKISEKNYLGEPSQIKKEGELIVVS